MTNLRSRFVARFGEGLAETIERSPSITPRCFRRRSSAARTHSASPWSGRGFECLTRPAYRLEHGITAPWADLLGWICDEAALDSFDGSMDLSGRGRGLFDAILGPHSEADFDAGLEAAEDWLVAAIPVVATA